MTDDPIQTLVDQIRGFIHGNEMQAIIMACIILVATIAVARLCTFIIRKLLRSDGSPLPSSSILVNVVRVCVWFIGISIILAACFNVNVTGVITALGVGGIAVSLGLQGTIQNFFGGMQITLMKIIKPGDHVIVGSTEGIVKDVSWRQTIVRDFEGCIHLIPNSVINSEEVERVSPAGLLITPFTFAYNGQDVAPQIHAMEKAAKGALHPKVELYHEPQIVVTALGSGTVTANLRFVVKDTKYVREARDAALAAIAPLTTGPLSKPSETAPRDAAGKAADASAEAR